MNPVEAHYIFEQREFMRAHRLASYTHVPKGVRFAFLLFGCLLAILGILRIPSNQSDALALVLFACVIGFFTWFPTFQARKYFGKFPLRNKQLNWKFGKDGISITTFQGESQFGWDKIIKAAQCQEGYLLFSARTIYSWLPRKAFASRDEYEAFEKLVKEKVGVIKKV
ncbi:MAG TPA: YcxB family protein [Candidatus Sumerlaeota bacterium]|nr:YcxB family protein [Candidatus Sumerlaeota bacterium]HPS00700.1 YcxB family protein [Candidatus Sumerlaeota bacterium]